MKNGILTEQERKILIEKLLNKLKVTKEKADREGWISAEEVEREFGLRD